MRKMKSLSLLMLALLVFSPVASSVEAAPATGHRGLDPTPLVEWFGGTVTSGFRDPARPYHVGIDFGVGWGAPICSQSVGKTDLFRWKHLRRTYGVG